MTDDLQKLLNAATPGTWVRTNDSGEIATTDGFFIGRAIGAVTSEGAANGDLFALAPTLAARVIAADKVVAAARELAAATQLEWGHDWPEGADPLSRTQHALAAYDSLTTPSAPAPQST
jgi:hypothetical protein